MEMIHMILYVWKNLRGSMAREDIYKMARALSRDTSPSSKRLPKYPPYQHKLMPLAAGYSAAMVDLRLDNIQERRQYNLKIAN